MRGAERPLSFASRGCHEREELPVRSPLGDDELLANTEWISTRGQPGRLVVGAISAACTTD
jgi:hypothetical protein